MGYSREQDRAEIRVAQCHGRYIIVVAVRILTDTAYCVYRMDICTYRRCCRRCRP